MTFDEAIDLIMYIPAEIAILFVGDAGIGKSEFARQLSEKLKLYLAEYNCAEASDLGDVLGLPDIDGDNTVFKPPKWFVKDRPVLLFLDEINRPGAQAIIKGMMGLALTRKLGDNELAAGSRIMAAINPDRDNIYEVLRFDPAQTNRFWVCEIECDADEWIVNFAIPHHVNSTVIDYISDNEHDLHTLSDKKCFELARESKKYTGVLSTPRSWTMLSKVLNTMETQHAFNLDTETGRDRAQKRINKLACGFIGIPLAEKFSKYYVNREKTVRARDILEASADDWDKLEVMVRNICTPEKMFIARSLCENIYAYIKKRCDTMYTDADYRTLTPKAYQYGENFNRFVHICSPELISDMYYRCIKPESDNAPWMTAIGTACPESMSKMSDILKAAVSKKRVDTTVQQTQTLTHRKMPNPKNLKKAAEDFVTKAREQYDQYERVYGTVKY